jgi:carotenoid cleavage dioxygenase-like enzyme
MLLPALSSLALILSCETWTTTTAYASSSKVLSRIRSHNSSPKKRRSLLQNIDRFLTALQKPQDQLADHTYLKHNYAPVSDIYVKAFVQVVEGGIPRTLNGMYCRNGPNPVYRNRMYHWFDGDAMLHNLRFENGKAFYTNQYVPSPRYQIEQDMGEDFFPTLGEYKGILGFLKILIGPSMVKPVLGENYGITALSPNTSCLMYRDKFYCLNEGNVPFECKLTEDGRLEAVGFEFFDQTLDYPVSAHPRIDDNGDLLFHSYTTAPESLARDGTIKVGRFSSETGKVENYFSPTTKTHISFAHNLLFTKSHMIVYDCSVHFDVAAMFHGGSFFRTNKDYNLLFGVMPKTATSADHVHWFDTGAPGGIVHPLNSWEEDDGTIVIWTPFCDNLTVDLESDEINKFHMVEFRLHPQTGEVTKEVIDDSVNIEFSVAPKMGSFVRYGYTAIFEDQDPSTPGEGAFAGFCVWDMVERKLHSQVFYDGYGGEPIIIESPDDNDNRVYVGVYVQKGDDSFFHLYDGETTELVVKLKMPARVPYGFHGLYITGDELRNHIQHHKSERGQETELQLSS